MNKALPALPENDKSIWRPLTILKRKDIPDYDDNNDWEWDTKQIHRKGGKRQLTYHGHVQTLDTMQNYAVEILIDSGCTKSIMDLDWAKGMGFNYQEMHKPMLFRNVDGSENTGGVFQHSINI